MDNLVMESQVSSVVEYYLPYKDNQLFVKYFKPDHVNLKLSTCLLLVHWMDNRGHKGNSIYNKIGTYYATTIGIPVFLFDIQGSGESTGNFEFPERQKYQIKTVYEHIAIKLDQEYNSTRKWAIIPVVHSISAIAVMSAIDEGLPIKSLIWIAGPPSHFKSLRRELSSRAKLGWYKFRFMAFIDTFSGLIGLPLKTKLFGYKFRVKDLYKGFSNANGAKMMLSHPEMDILALFGSADPYMRLSDLDEEFPKELSKHIKRVIVSGADHSFEMHVEELITMINEFINKIE